MNNAGTTRPRHHLLVLLLVLGLLVSQRVVSSVYWVLMPGVAIPLDDVVEVEGRAFASEGDFHLVAVSTSKASFGALIRSWFDPAVDLIPASSQIPAGVEFEEYRQMMNSLMRESQVVAAAVALMHAGYDVAFQSEARVAAFMKNSPAESVLRVGDAIVAVDGVEIETVEQAIRLIQDREIGDSVSITVKRDGQLVHTEVNTAAITNSEGQKKAGIRAYLSSSVEYDLPFEVTIDSEGIGGSSAGLMFALEVRDRLDEPDLTGGLKVYGTGTLDVDGNVGPVGGVKQKVITAQSAGADVFLCPQDNYDEAQSVASSVLVVPVASFSDAYAFLTSGLGRRQAAE